MSSKSAWAKFQLAKRLEGDEFMTACPRYCAALDFLKEGAPSLPDLLRGFDDMEFCSWALTVANCDAGRAHVAVLWGDGGIAFILDAISEKP